MVGRDRRSTARERRARVSEAERPKAGSSCVDTEGPERGPFQVRNVTEERFSELGKFGLSQTIRTVG